MRAVILFSLLFPNLSFAASATFDSLMNESAKIRANANSNDFDSRKKELNKLFVKVQRTLEEYKKKNPKEADPEEEKILLLSYGLEIPLKLQKHDKDSCITAHNQLKLNKLGSRADSAELPPEGQEADEWLTLLCK